MRVLRKSSQLLFLALFGYLLIRTRSPLPSTLAVDLFLRTDPLLGLVSMISSRTLVIKALPALLLLSSTVILGRFFCGWICPLGSIHFKLQTSTFKLQTSTFKLQTSTFKLKEPLLIFILTAALFSASFVWLFDPLATLTRTFTMGLRSGVFLAILLWAILLAIVALNVIGPRFWCRNLCPLGGLLGLLARFNVFQRRVSEECDDCLACQEACPVGMSPSPYLKSECLQCRSCLGACPVEAITFQTRWPKINPEDKFDLSRRRFLASLGVGILAAASLRASRLIGSRGRGVIRPPGALEEDKFVASCVRCGKCVQVCPTGGLQPALFEAGIEGLLTPRLMPRIGPCQADCLLCGRVCPSGAISELTLEEKRRTQIGLAGIDRQRCLSWSEGITCLVCSQVCPYEAIELRWMNGSYRPTVKEGQCVGCGTCEYQCPVEGPAAITVLATRG
ncbi:MAG: 4Fe-4S dicluster domain-containing protein [Chloroflexi bacterium]|nr:4Fe-4S dicluster domain-containing protein [Chloroflexota bacterium]